MKRFLLWAALLAACAPSFAQQSADEHDVSWRAASQIAVRGNMIERVGGGVQSGEDDIVAELAKMPADDSGKWQLTLLTMPNCAACEKLKSDLTRSKAWAGSSLVNVEDHTKSLLHFNTYRYDDPTVQEWSKGLWGWLKKNGKERDAQSYPQLVLQPPADGSYGPKTEVVYWQVGYGGNPDKLRDAVLSTMRAYAKQVKTVPHGDDGGHGQLSGHGQLIGGWSPPYPIPPANVPATEGDWSPNVLIPPTQTPTPAELAAALPGASAEFLLSQLVRGATVEQAQAAYALEKQRAAAELQAKQAAEAQAAMQAKLDAALKQFQQLTTVPQPATPAAVSPLPSPGTVTTALAIVGFVGTGIGWILSARKKRVAAGIVPKINDEQAAKLQRLEDLLNNVSGQSPQAL